MRNIFKLIVVYIRLKQVSYSYRWIQVVLVTQRIRKQSITSLRLHLSDGSSGLKMTA